MAQQQLQTVIVLGGRVDASFGAMGAKLNEFGDRLVIMGNTIDRMGGRWLRQFGAEALEEYIGYDDMMRWTKSLGQFTDAQMSELGKLNKEIAQSSIYGPTQLAQTEAFMAQLGLNEKEIRSLIAPTLDLAAVGKLELTDSIEYLYYSLNSLGMSLAESRELVDMMTKTSSVGATEVDTLGQSMMRLGSALDLFKGGAPEALTILTAISKYGKDMKGSMGGTSLRNFMLRLVAPQGTDEDMLKDLFDNYDEMIAEYKADLLDGGFSMGNAAETLLNLGVTAYDSAGQMRPMLDVIEDLRVSLSGLDDAEKNAALSKIFGVRGFVVAKNLIQMTREEYQALMGEIVDSAGYAQYAYGEMYGGLGGAQKSLEASMADLKVSIGDALAPTLQMALGWLEGFVETLSNMDGNALAGIVTGLGGIAVLGPGLQMAGWALKGIGLLFTPGGAIVLGATAVAVLAGHLHQLSEERFRGNFGELQVDIGTLREYVDGITTAFNEQEAALAPWRSEMEEAQATYAKLTEELAGELLMSVLTNKQLGDTDKEKLTKLGNDIAATVLEGIKTAEASHLHWLDLALGGMETDDETESFINLVGWADEYFGGLYDEASALGAGLNRAIFEAWLDGTISEDERREIQEYVDKLNSVQSEIARTLDKQAFNTHLGRIQRAGWDNIGDLLVENAGKMNEELATLEEKWAIDYGIARTAYEMKLERAEGYWEREKIERDWETAERALARRFGLTRGDTTEKYGGVAASMFNSLMNDSEFSDAWGLMTQLHAKGVPRDAGGWLDYTQLDLSAILQKDDEIANKLIWLANNRGRLEAVLSPYREYFQVAQMLEMLESANSLANALSGQLAGSKEWEGAPGGFWMIGEGETFDYDEPTSPGIALNDFFSLAMDAARAKRKGFNTALRYAFETNTFPIGVSQEEQEALLGELLGPMPMKIDIINAQKEADDAKSIIEKMTPEIEATLRVNGDFGPIGWTPKAMSVLGGAFGKSLTPYSDGGRASVASIFGEAGPEWAIPEEHTRRTAELLDAARRASGFTWGDLMATTGGLNANAHNTPTQVIYSPTIYAQDARGVEEKLREDKKRFEKWYRDMKHREQLEAYS